MTMGRNGVPLFAVRNASGIDYRCYTAQRRTQAVVNNCDASCRQPRSVSGGELRECQIEVYLIATQRSNNSAVCGSDAYPVSGGIPNVGVITTTLGKIARVEVRLSPSLSLAVTLT